MTETSQRCTIEATGQTYQLIRGFPQREELADWLAEPGITVLCLFPESYRAEQTQVQLRNSLRTELDKLDAPYNRCLTLAVSDPSLGDQLDTFDFKGACAQVLRQLTPRQPQNASVPIPGFGPRAESGS